MPHEQVGDAARAHLDRPVPCGGEAVGAFALAQLVKGRGRVARDLRRHRHRAGRGEMRDKETLLLVVDTGPPLAVLGGGGEAELGRQVVGIGEENVVCGRGFGRGGGGRISWGMSDSLSVR